MNDDYRSFDDRIITTITSQEGDGPSWNETDEKWARNTPFFTKAKAEAEAFLLKHLRGKEEQPYSGTRIYIVSQVRPSSLVVSSYAFKVTSLAYQIESVR